MRKCDEYYALHCYKYAPEQFQAYKVTGFSNGNRNIPLYEKIELSHEEISRCGNAFICKGRNAALAEVKKIMRKRDAAPSCITYGFRLLDNPRQYVFIRSCYCKIDELSDRLRTYKEIKKHLDGKNWEHVEFIEGKLGAGFKVEEVTEHKQKINRDAPIVIHLI